MIRELKDEGMTIVMATHEMAFAREVADRVVFLDGGEVVEDGHAGARLLHPERRADCPVPGPAPRRLSDRGTSPGRVAAVQRQSPRSIPRSPSTLAARAAAWSRSESTIISHGLPARASADVARQIEAAVRESGAVPATVARARRAGADRSGRRGARPDRHRRVVVKAASATSAVVLATGSPGATTVASTAYLANRAGIDVFATGGLGGVHRGAQDLGRVGRPAGAR